MCVWVIKKPKTQVVTAIHSVIRCKMFGDGHAYPSYMQLKKAKEKRNVAVTMEMSMKSDEGG